MAAQQHKPLTPHVLSYHDINHFVNTFPKTFSNHSILNIIQRLEALEAQREQLDTRLDKLDKVSVDPNELLGLFLGYLEVGNELNELYTQIQSIRKEVKVNDGSSS